MHRAHVTRMQAGGGLPQETAAQPRFSAPLAPLPLPAPARKERAVLCRRPAQSCRRPSGWQCPQSPLQGAGRVQARWMKGGAEGGSEAGALHCTASVSRRQRPHAAATTQHIAAPAASLPHQPPQSPVPSRSHHTCAALVLRVQQRVGQGQPPLCVGVVNLNCLAV